jgi:hypothetical protein
MAVLEGSGKEMMVKTRERDTKGIVFSMFVYVSSKGVCIYLQYRSLDSTSYKLTVYLEKDKF